MFNVFVYLFVGLGWLGKLLYSNLGKGLILTLYSSRGPLPATIVPEPLRHIQWINMIVSSKLQKNSAIGQLKEFAMPIP